MKAFVVTGYKQPLQLLEVPDPTLGEHDLLVQVEATGLNQLDEKIRLGEFKQLLPYKTPFTLGHDVAGTVTAVGSAVRGFAAGDRVFARVRDGRIGTFAEKVAVHAEDAAQVPASLSIEEAASLPLVALTAWQALVERAKVRPGQKVLVHAGSGGVGTIAIQIAKHLGAHVATTASASQADFVRGLGADEVIDYRTQDFAEVLSGYDVVLDSLGEQNLAKSLTVLRRGGLAIGIAGPPDPAFARSAGLNPVVRLVIAALSRKVRRQAAALGVRYEFLFMRASGEQLTRLASLVEQGALRPVVGKTVPFSEVPAALDSLSRGGIRGKVVAQGVR